MTFLPADYALPKTESGYMRLEDGLNIFRVLSDAIIGYEYWTQDKKPVRSKEYPTDTPNARIEDDGTVRVKHFWAFVVWNYTLKKVQILEVTQRSVQDAINNLVMDEDWGDPKTYDLKVVREGERLETKYSVSPRPKSELAPEIKQAYEETDINLNALYVGEDPFNSGNDVTSDDGPLSDIPIK